MTVAARPGRGRRAWRAPSALLLIAVLMSVVSVAACAPRVNAPGPAVTRPALAADGFLAADGEKLPLRTWMPEDGAPRAVIVALHGFNDYSNFFTDPGTFLATEGIATYAYDQRGFGQTRQPGLWSGVGAYADDLKAVTEAVRRRHPGVPLYLLGESMGGAVIMVAMTGPGAPEVDGIILSSPAVWGRSTMPWYQRLALWLGAHTVPWMTVTGRGLGIKPSDNIEMLRALGRDPLVIKETRVDTIYGLVNLMDAALESSAAFDRAALILYGAHDEIIPMGPTRAMVRHLPPSAGKRQRLALYEDGYHMLLRDLQARTVWVDIAAWITDPGAPLPSGADERAATILAKDAAPAERSAAP
ncbi:MAG: alpha/beta hydrolase [Proteobacteria bacterium]|nr:alpha/beta hydrolase [Pseudomonadota bacterium]